MYLLRQQLQTLKEQSEGAEQAGIIESFVRICL